MAVVRIGDRGSGIGDRETPWAYRKGSSPLHRLPAGFKLASLLLLSLAAFFPGSQQRLFFVLAGIIVILILLSFVGRIKPWQLLRGSGPLFLIVIVLLTFQAIDFNPFAFKTDGLAEGFIFCLRLGAAFAAGSLLFAVTTLTEIRRALSRFETALHLDKYKPGLGLALMLGFLPKFFEAWEDASLAWKSRGGKKNLSMLISLIPLVLEKMMVKAANTAEALESRALNA